MYDTGIEDDLEERKEERNSKRLDEGYREAVNRKNEARAGIRLKG